jgi:hypothetical protein
VLDDIDSVFKRLEGVNILKAAMDTKREQREGKRKRKKENQIF